MDSSSTKETTSSLAVTPVASSTPSNAPTAASTQSPAAQETGGPWWRDPGLRALNLRLLAVFISAVSTGYDSAVVGSLLAVPRWYEDLGLSPHDTRLIGILTASSNLGGILGFFLAAWLADRMGRRPFIMAGDVLVVASALGQSFCTNPRLWILLRATMGFGSLMIVCTCPVLLSELAHTRHRGSMVACYCATFYGGAIAAAWTSFGSLSLPSVWDWRLPVLLQAVPPTIQLPLMLLVPESPRWLAARGRTHEARAVLERFHPPGLAALELVQITSASAASSTRPGPLPWTAFLRTPSHRRRLFLVVGLTLLAQCSGSALVTYAFAAALRAVGVSSSSSQIAINAGLLTFALCVALGAATLLVDRAGRVALFRAGSACMLVAMAGMAGATATSNGPILVVCLFVFQLGFDFGFTAPATAYVTEVLPVGLRARGVALHYALSLAGAAAAQYVNPVAMEALGWRYYVVFVGLLGLGMGAFWTCFPETKGRTLEEVEGMFEKRGGGREGVDGEGCG